MRAVSPPVEVASSTVRSADGTAIAVHTLGVGKPVLVLGGAMRSARDYLPFAAALGDRFRVHVIDRRGRGDSGPFGDGWSIDRERDDLLAVQAATGAKAVFGHSFGGLVVLETAARSGVFDQVAVYEPAVSIHGSIPLRWMPRYRELLDEGRGRAAFACFAQQAGHAPGPVSKLPGWYMRAIMRLVVRADQWARFEPLLEANLMEHAQVAARDDTFPDYARIVADVLLLAGARSPAFASTDLVEVLQRTIPRTEIAILAGLNHNAPDDGAPVPVADRVATFLAGAA